jgi:hypothetical protein
MEFSCLNWNLMVPKWHRLIVTIDSNAPKVNEASSFDLCAAGMAR